MRRNRTATFLLALAVAVVVAVVLASVFLPAATPPANAADPIVLTVTGNGQTKQYTVTDLQALPAYQGWYGIINSSDNITAPQPVKGVALATLLDDVGGMTAEQSCDTTAIDGYGMTFMYGEVNGNVPVYKDVTPRTQEDPKAAVSCVVVYEQNGVPLTLETGGPLRLAFCQPTDVDQVVDGHLTVKWLDEIKLRGALPDWTVKMYGLKRKNGTRQTSSLDRMSYLSCAAPGCHGRVWLQKSTGRVWTGVDLHRIMGRVDGGPSHGDDAFNLSLAVRGYRIKLVSATGKYVVIKSQTMLKSSKIMLANKRDGVDLPAKWYPLRLVGPYVDTSKFIGRITKIYMLPK
jgi:DMSO/TMAO reductase YedYZ molybdopterin-dependent catalytic subunit